MAYPVSAVKIPHSLGGQVNGKLDATLRVELGVPGRPLATGHELAVRAFQAFAAEVLERFGLTLTVTSTPDAYRSYLVQERTFRDRYTTTYLAGRPSKMWNGVRWYQKPGTAMAAVPGTSNHGWGLAFDTCYWINDAIAAVTSRMDCFNWMLGNAFRFGLSWEAQSEPWHLRYYAGDDVPQAVTDRFAPPPPVTPPLNGVPVDCYLDHNGAIYGHNTELNVKQWVPNGEAWAMQKGLRALAGKEPLPVHVADKVFMQATGPVLGPVPGGFDGYGATV